MNSPVPIETRLRLKNFKNFLNKKFYLRFSEFENLITDLFLNNILSLKGIYIKRSLFIQYLENEHKLIVQIHVCKEYN